MWTDVEVIEDLAEEKGTRGLETPGDVIGKKNYLAGSWLRQGLFFVRGAPVGL